MTLRVSKMLFRCHIPNPLLITKVSKYLSLSELELRSSQKFSEQFADGFSDSTSALSAANNSRISFTSNSESNDDFSSSSSSPFFTSSFLSSAGQPTNVASGLDEEFEISSAPSEEDEFGFLTTRAAMTRQISPSSNKNNSYNMFSEGTQTPEQALRIAESCFTSPIGYAYATTPLVDLVHACYRDGLLTTSPSSSSSSKKEQVLSGFVKWFVSDPLCLCKSQHVLDKFAGPERASRMKSLFLEIFNENEGLVPNFDPSKTPAHLVSPSPLTRVLYANGLVLTSNQIAPIDSDEYEHQQDLISKVEPWKKLVRGIALALCRNDVYLDLPSLSTAIIDDSTASSSNMSNDNIDVWKCYNNNNNSNNKLFLHSSNGLPSLNEVLNLRRLNHQNIANLKKEKKTTKAFDFSSPKRKKGTKNKNENEEDDEEEEDDYKFPAILTKSSGVVKKREPSRLHDHYLDDEDAKNRFSASTPKSVDELSFDRAVLYVKLLLGAAAECGSYSCALHAAEIMKSRNMQTTMDIQRLMACACHTHIRREQDWKFRASGGLLMCGKKWVSEYFPMIEKERKFTESGF